MHNILLLFHTNQSVAPIKSELDSYVFDVANKINSLEYISMTVDEICENYPASKSSLINAFKKHTGSTIVGYMVKRKLAYAATFLLHSDYTVSQISSMLGYDSFSYFLKIFKQAYRMTPSEYRKHSSAK